MMAEEPMGRILVIDDSPTNVATIRLELEQVGYEVLTAATGRAGLETAVTRLPDVVLLDILMPDVDGYEVCRQIRTTPATSGIPVVVITGLQGSADRLLALEVGANDFISKPVDGVELLARVRSLVRLKHLNDQLQRQAALAEAAAGRERIAAILESITDAFVAVDEQWRFTYVNQRAEHMLGKPREALLGADFWGHFATTPDSPAAEQSHRAMVDHVPVAFESLYPPLDAWLEVHVYPRGDGVSFYFHDITARKRAEEEIHELNALLEQRVRERTAELESANRQLDQASRMKSGFLASMSHELRTPLNGIIGFAQLMRDGKVGQVSHEHLEYLGYILSSADHLLQLINDVLDLSKVEAGKMDFHPEPVDLGKLVADAVDSLHALADEKRITVEVSVDSALGTVILDAGKLRQVLYNYLSNALKFTSEGGRVAVRAAPEDEDSFRLEVEDSGIGIAAEDIDRLFSEFQQLEGGTDKRYPGTGLGLALTKRIAEAQGGRVGVASVPGQGSTFFAVLPRESHVGSERPSPARRPAMPARVGAPAVLVIEDDPKDREWLQAALVGAGYAVEAVASGKEAIAACAERRFDAVTLDLLLPDMHGWEVLKTMRAGVLNSNVPVVVVTMLADRGLAAGFAIQDFLTKPIDPDALLASLQRLAVVPGETRAVLVVDDDPTALRLMEATLQQLGYKAMCASDGLAGLQAAAESLPAAVVLDLLMPEMDGFQFLDRFRRTAHGRRTPVIIWTSKELSAEERELLRTSAQEVVVKGRGGTAPLLEALKAYLSPANPAQEPASAG